MSTRVFITGGTGTIGEAVIKELRRAGHAVTGLSRSETSDAKLRALGAMPHRGLLDQSASYQRPAAAHDALLHVAFDYGNAIATDRVAIQALLAAAKGASAPKVVVYTSGVLVLGNTGTPADESASTEGAIPMIAWRPAYERLTLERIPSDFRLCRPPPRSPCCSRSSTTTAGFSPMAANSPNR